MNPLLFSRLNRLAQPEPIPEPNIPMPEEEEEDPLITLIKNLGKGPAQTAYRDAVTNVPTRQPLTTRQLIGAGIGALGGAISGKPEIAQGLYDLPYKRQVEDYALRIRGLGEAADIEARGEAHALQGENIRRQMEQAKVQQAYQNRQLERQAARDSNLDEYRTAQLEVARQNARTAEERARIAEELGRLRADVAQTQAETRAQKQDVLIHPEQDLDVMSDTFGQTIDKVYNKSDLKPGQSLGAKKGAPEAIKDAITARQVIEAAYDIEELLQKPHVRQAIGFASGNWNKLKEKLGVLAAQGDQDVKDLITQMDMLAMSHTGVFNARGGPIAWKKLESAVGNINTSPEQFQGGLNAVVKNANAIIAGAFPGQSYTSKRKRQKEQQKPAGNFKIEEIR